MHEMEWKNNKEPEKPQQDPAMLEFKKYGDLDLVTVQMMIIGNLVTSGNAPADMQGDTRGADKILESSAKPEWFTDENLRKLFVEVLTYYRENREKITKETYREMYALKESPDETRVRAELVMKCLSSVLTRRGYDVAALVKRLRESFVRKRASDLFGQLSQNEKQKGISAAIAEFRSCVIRELDDPQGASLVAGNIVEDFEGNMNEMLDWKHHPEKYAGQMCGIKYIDEVTRGFLPGQMTTLVGANGGYKTSTKINIGLGCWRRGLNVLYVTLETPFRMIEKRVMAMGTRRVSAKRVREGLISSPDDVTELDELEKERASASPERVVVIDKKIARLKAIISDVKLRSGGEWKAEYTDEFLIREFMGDMSGKQNKLIVMSGGEAQSNKIKFSQIEAWLKEQRAVFKPDIVIVDYLGLVAAENPTDSRAADLGDICKYMRKVGANMGFHVLTSAQYSRKAFERMRTYGFNMEKTDLGTDDIADSSAIGNDSDFVIMLWFNKDSGKLTFMNVKNRHGERLPNTELPVDKETNIVGSQDTHVDDTSSIAQNATQKDVNNALSMGKAGKLTAPASETEDELLGITPSMSSMPQDEDSYQPPTPSISINVDEDVGDL